ncbi:helicase C-terminal domain-containing protein [Stutzerimonas kunmingensis]|uniref:ATP-dependent DNA helicase n=1 Tax=Stutzerimonas kunmingensis TaxID=1211807 RepID=A0A9X1N0M8_9GAMM|nr:helicase C-terminal domain-containing protein [Stutzerimonas kunmingensis]MCD1607715.1 ATP-dependent DNA helicase [Stutzerimonas kunmingensis]PNG02762.1 ATP-dependent DNA helicase [Stutzerimonas kunmingensis]UIP30877.1 ATP-dependent DNA helicase [Stutzerimonas kunmingensis]
MSYRVAVRALCEFTAKVGDLDLRFTPSPTALEGIAGHAQVTARRGEGYEREVALEGQYGKLMVRGRADGYDPARNRLEEIKTFRGDLERQPANHRQLHWAQAKIYGWLLCQKRQLDEVELALVYFDVASHKETLFVERHGAQSLRLFFETQCQAFLDWAEQELAHRDARNQALTALGFPHADFRTGQRQLAEAVYKAACTGTTLMAQAPTGIGKTLGTLFPQLKAFPGQQLDKLFFLAAKTSGRRLALDALQTLQRNGAGELRVLELIARDKACEHPDKACHGESCLLAKGFYDRLPAARAAALQHSMLDQAALREVALAHQVCPYYLSQELARWADAVVGDYNYYFDISALLYGLTLNNDWRISVLVDEAHNLLERARGMYSAELDQRAFAGLGGKAPAPLKRPLGRVQRCWNDLHREQLANYQVQPELPLKLLGALQQVVSAVTDYLGEQPGGLDAELQRAYFDAMHFCRIAELFGEHSLFDISLLPATGRGKTKRSMLCLRNVVPAPFLAPRLEQARSTVLFSATLNPRRFHADMLGLPTGSAWIEVESPFQADQLRVCLAEHVSTRYQHRQASLGAVVALIAQQYRERAGNYLAFFSSFDYLQQVTALLREQYPDVPFWEQTRGMQEAARSAFLDRFTEHSKGVGFAVLGGAFAEGIDLPGNRLIGAFIATLGLPQVNPVNEQFKARLEQLFGRGLGYDYTYLYPGLQKVVQAAGRVIRTQSDEGVVHLIDDRFGRSQIRRLLPSWWQLSPVSSE